MTHFASCSQYCSEHGIATHYITSRSVPSLLSHLAEFDNPSFSQIHRTIEELHAERQAHEPSNQLTGLVRQALDTAFGHNTVEEIMQSLEILEDALDTRVQAWAKRTLKTLHMRSPTSLKVALSALRRGKQMTLLEALQMEIRIASAFCVSWDSSVLAPWFSLQSYRMKRAQISVPVYARFWSTRSRGDLHGPPTISLTSLRISSNDFSTKRHPISHLRLNFLLATRPGV